MQMPKFHIIGYVVFLALVALAIGTAAAVTLNNTVGQ
jgi:hypothetical protein